LDALGPIDLRDRRRVLIKPNLVSVRRQLASTHVDALRATLDWLRERYDGPVIIGEGAAMAPTEEGFRNFGYDALANTYGVQLVDFNADERTYPLRVYDHRLRPQTLALSATAVESDFIISVGPPKTHDLVMITASIKNVVLGTLIDRDASCPRTGSSILPILWKLYSMMPLQVKLLPIVDEMRLVFSRKSASDKARLHQSYPVIHLNIFLGARVIRPHLAVLDAWEAMEGEGPTQGDPVPLHAAVASLDPVAADAVAAHLMGFDPFEIGYLWYCHRAGLGQGDLESIQMVGNGDLQTLSRPFRRHSTYPRQRHWRDERVETLFQQIIAESSNAVSSPHLR
jgi:uncharacterized protein (DUF362 family)